jgi:DNA-binding XRE family transcriptional regulator
MLSLLIERAKEPSLKESLAEYVKRIRTSLSLSQTELALKAGIHLQSLGKIERGMTTKLNSKSQRGLAVAFRLSIWMRLPVVLLLPSQM